MGMKAGASIVDGMLNSKFGKTAKELMHIDAREFVVNDSSGNEVFSINRVTKSIHWNNKEVENADNLFDSIKNWFNEKPMGVL